MLKKDLAEALNISTTMVTKLERRGMPTSSVQAARVWRDKHLHPGYRKEYKLGSSGRRRQPQRQVQHDVDPDRALDAVELLGIAAEMLLRAGQPLTPMEPLLRDALRQVPVEHRDRLVLSATDDEAMKLYGRTAERDVMADDVRPFPLIVWHALVEPVFRAVKAEQDKLGGPVELSDDEVDEMAAFWYQAAAGEVVPA